MLNRRDALNLGIAATAAAVLDSTEAPAQRSETPPLRIIDTNVSLFRWPFRRLPFDDTEALVKKLCSLGIKQAWAGSFEGLLHRDIAAVNRRIAEVCQQHAELTPIGSINLTLPDWSDDLRRCIDHNMPGIRIHPNYHGYTLDDLRFMRLLEQATAARRFIQVAAAMEDTRTQHPRLRAADVNLDPLPQAMTRIPSARVQILNYRPRMPQFDALAKTPGLSFDTARVEGTDGVAVLIKQVSKTRVMFGTHAPLLVPEAALIRVHESGQLDDSTLRAILSNNANNLLGGVIR